MEFTAGQFAIGLPSTLSSSSQNDVTGTTHSHEVTSYPDGDAYPGELLSSDVSGDLKLHKLTLSDRLTATLVDSPVNLGAHYRHIDLSPGGIPSYSMDLVADSAAALNIDASAVQSFEHLVREANVLFGGPHRYRAYHFLVTLSDPIAKIAQELD